MWSRQTALEPHPGPGIGLIVAWITVILLTYHWARVVWRPHRAAAGRRGGASHGRRRSGRPRDCWRASTTTMTTTVTPTATGRRRPASSSCPAPRRRPRPIAATVRRWPAPPRRPWCGPPPRPSRPAARTARRGRGTGRRAPALPDRRHRDGASRTFFSIARSRRSRSAPRSRGTLPIASHLSPMVRSAARAASRSEVSSLSASASSASLASALARNSASRSAVAALRAEKNVSWADLNRCHSASSTSLAARPAAFHSVSRSRNAAAVGPQSVESAQFLGPFAQCLLGLAWHRPVRGRGRRNAIPAAG